MAFNIQKQLRNIYQQQQLLYMFVFGLVLSIAWLVVAIFSSQTSTKIDAELQRMSVSLNPNINEEVIEILEAKRSFSDEELANFEILRVFEIGKENIVVLPLGSEPPSLEQLEPTITRTSLLDIAVQNDSPVFASNSAQPASGSSDLQNSQTSSASAQQNSFEQFNANNSANSENSFTLTTQ